jgi:hypothetical protein
MPQPVFFASSPVARKRPCLFAQKDERDFPVEFSHLPRLVAPRITARPITPADIQTDHAA